VPLTAIDRKGKVESKGTPPAREMVVGVAYFMTALIAEPGGGE